MGTPKRHTPEVDESRIGSARSFPDEASLVAALQAGDPESFEILVHTHGGRMLRVAQRFLQSGDEANDCVQDACLRAFRAIGAFQERSSLWTWLHRIVVTSALMQLRSRRRHPEQSLDDLMPEFDAHGCRLEDGVSVDLDTLLEAKANRTRVRDAIDLLPGSYRDVLLLRDIEGFDTEETARLLTLSAGAVKTRLHRARAALKRLLEPILSGWES